MTGDDTPRTVPNPGSDEAMAAGCECPVLDNNRGRWSPDTAGKSGGWWIVLGCPLHGVANRQEST